VSNRDYPTMMGIFLISSIAIVISSLLTDITYTLFDPRVRLS
jgi:peptide/nickel transport system permease protein